MLDAKHKPRISGMSFGLLISELNNDNLKDVSKSFSELGGIPDGERAQLRAVAKYVLGLPLVLACLAFLASRLFRASEEET